MIKILVLVLIWTWLSRNSDAKHSSAAILDRVSSSLKVANVGLGTYSRSAIISSVSQSLRGEDAEQVRENLNQAIVTLAVMDIGGGALLPVAESIVEEISKKATFQATRRAWRNYNEQIRIQLDVELETLDDIQVKNVLNTEKARVIRQFETDVSSLGEGTTTLKLIKKAKKWLKVKSIGKVLGPIFDIIGIGLDVWSLTSTIQDCTSNPATCNYGEIASASLGIASGLVGIGTFVACLVVSTTVGSVLGPVGAVVGLVLAIGSTLISLFYEPPIDYEAIARARKFDTMMELDKYSRFQLHSAHKFFIDNKFAIDDLYVMNQGHLPNWNNQNLKIQFGKSSNNHIRLKEYLMQKCEEPKRLGQSENGFVCEYLFDGGMKQSSSYILGHAFYGFTRNSKTYRVGGSYGDDPEYGGSIILVNTDKVQQNSLPDVDSNIIVKGYEIRTDLKTNNDNSPYDDIVAIGKMTNIASGERIVIRTGAGNDALNIDGMLGRNENILDADLGNLGHNTLSFHGISDTSLVDVITFNANTGSLQFGYELHQVGTVMNVEFVGGSPFLDRITLGASKAGENGIDFTVVKRKGSSEYSIDIQELASQNEARHFKIIDSTEGGEQNINLHENPCDSYKPLLTIKNFDFRAVTNDILYQGGKIKIYGHRTNNKKRSARNPHKRSVTWGCRGGSSKGGQNGKVLLATLTVHSKCSIHVSSKYTDGSCMSETPRMEKLPLVFYEGSNFSYNFDSNIIRATPMSDVLHLECPSGIVTMKHTINLGGSRGDTIVMGSKFLDDCNIDGMDRKIWLQKRNWNEAGDGQYPYYWVMAFANNNQFPMDDDDSGWKHEFYGVEKIVNEYGDRVVNLRTTNKSLINLFAAHSKVTMETIGNILGQERSPEIKTEFLTCIEDNSNPQLCDSYPTT